MLIQSKRVWIADQFIPAQIEIDDNKITDIITTMKKLGLLIMEIKEFFRAL